MKKLMMIAVMLITLLEMSGVTIAAQPANNAHRRNATRRLARREVMRLRAQMQGSPMINITTTPDKLDLGMSGLPGGYVSTATVTVNIESNCLHGPVIASIGGLKNKGGDTIEPKRIFISGPETYGYVSMARPVVISKASVGPHSVDLSFKVETEVDDPAGKYEGAIVFTIAPPS